MSQIFVLEPTVVYWQECMYVNLKMRVETIDIFVHRHVNFYYLIKTVCPSYVRQSEFYYDSTHKLFVLNFLLK